MSTYIYISEEYYGSEGVIKLYIHKHSGINTILCLLVITISERILIKYQADVNLLMSLVYL
jgi:hypothetical protein